jgi:hypothetical protein
MLSGLGRGGSRIETVEEDTDSQSRYGVVEAVKVDKEVDDEDAAKTLAQNLLALHAQPKETVTATLASTINFDLGDRVDVVDEGLGLDFAYRVKRITYDYDAERGEIVTVELGFPLPDLREELLRTRTLERWMK